MRRLTWDERKRQSNLTKHGLDFAHVADFDHASAVMEEDVRGLQYPKFSYKERRFIAIGLMRGRLVTVVFSKIAGGWHVISLRPSTKLEEDTWLGR